MHHKGLSERNIVSLSAEFWTTPGKIMLKIGSIINLEMCDHLYVPGEAPDPEAAVWFLNHALKMHRKTYS